jgi:uncharacterized membrane protein SpoIIM required for sporulation
MTSKAGIAAWIGTRAAAWAALAEGIGTRRRRRASSIGAATQFVDSYRNLARDLAGVRRFAPGTRVAAALETLYAQLHAEIHRSPRGGWRAVLDMLRDDLPAAMRELAGGILAMVSLMAGSAVAGYWLITEYPPLVSLVASEQMIEHVESGSLWTEGIINVTPSSLLSVQILSNNIVVSFFAVCAGLLFGLGTFYLIALNGFMLGALFAFVGQHGLGLALFTFIVAHGPVELSVICIAGAIGAAVGDSLIRPRHASRRESFQGCLARMTPLLGACVVLLIGSGFIEGFISPNPTYPLGARITIGVCYWILMGIALGGGLAPRRPLAGGSSSDSP